MTAPLWPRATNSVACFGDGWEMIEHVDGQDDEDLVEAFLTAYVSTPAAPTVIPIEADTDTFVSLRLRLEGTGTGLGASTVALSIAVYDSDTASYRNVSQDACDLDAIAAGVYREFRVSALIPRGATYRIAVTGASVTIPSSEVYGYILRSKT